MSEHLERSVEIAKLARLLGVQPKELSYLEEIPSTALQTLREQATDRLFGGDADRLRRVAAASKMIPVPMTVKIAQIAFGPVLCAATAGLLDPAHAVKVASKCPTAFLADITIHLDPRRAPDVIAAVPAPLVAAVAKELLARDEHVTMGRFVSYLSVATLREAVAEIPDNADILKVAFVMEGKSHLDDLIDVARDRIPALVRTAYEHDLWAEALDLIGHLSTENLAEIAEISTDQDDDLLNSLVYAAKDLQAWDILLPITALMKPESLRRFAAVPAVREDAVLADIVESALAGDLWLDMLPLTMHLPDELREQLAAYVAAKDDDVLAHLADLAHGSQMWDALLPLALAFTPEARARLARLPLFQREDVLRAAIDNAAKYDLWHAVLPLADVLPDAVKPKIAGAIGDLTREQMLSALRAASVSHNLSTLIDIALRQEPAGRQRVLEIVDGLDDLDEFAALLQKDTPDAVWTALLEVRDEMPERVRGVIRARAEKLRRKDVTSAL